MKARTLVVRGLSSLARLVEKLGEDQAVQPGSNATRSPGTPRSVSPAAAPVIYRQVPSFFTSSEGRFYLRLAEAVQERCLVMSKVRLADLVEAEGDEQQRFKGFARVAQKHVDFVLLNPTTFAVIAAIELDGSTHLKGKQARRDESKARVLESAGVPLLRFSSLEVLPTAIIAERLRLLLPSDINAPIEATASPALPEAAADAPTCRKCGKTMVRRESERGPFWGCPGFPKCWSTIRIKG